MNNAEQQEILRDVYELIAMLWCCPPDSDVEYEAFKKSARSTIDRLDSLDHASAALLHRFLSENDISEEYYIELFELDPKCALYVGSHSFDEPTTCAGAAVSDRNEYMIELGAIYRHFGREPNGIELPDYLPLMIDFLSLTAGQNDDPVREKLIREYLLPYLPPMRKRLEELETPYLYLLQALEAVLEIELIDVVQIQPLSAGTKG